jgi:hypothetical protein
MAVRFGFAAAAAALLCTPAWAQSVIINENFDSYADTNAMDDVWTPDLGQGNQPQTGPYGILVPDTGAGLTPPYDNPPGLQGKGVNILANINEYNGPATTQMANLVPTGSQFIRLTADIYDDAQVRRSGVGIRNDTVPRGFGVVGSNFVELGFYNTRDLDPVDGVTALNFTGYAYRLNTLFNTDSLVGSGLVQQPNWQNFDLDPILDRPDEEEAVPNDYTTQADIGPGWHRFTVEIHATYHKFTLDLFRDGVKNVTRDVNGDIEVGVGAAGVDAEVTWLVKPHNDATEPNDFDPYTSLRFGSHSGIGNTVEAVVDNIKLETVLEPVDEDADFDEDGDVDGADFLAWQRNVAVDTGATLGQGDADGNGDVNGDDLAIWEAKFGTATAAAQNVPEPASVALAGLALVAGLALRRRQ